MPERPRCALDGQGRRRTVHRTLPLTAETAFQAVSDVVATAAHSGEIVQLWWERRVDPGTVTVGDRFAAHNRFLGMDWTSTSTVTAADPGRRFAFAVSGTEHPTAIWSFTLTPVDNDQVEVGYSVELGDGPLMFGARSDSDPERRATATTQRRRTR